MIFQTQGANEETELTGAVSSHQSYNSDHDGTMLSKPQKKIRQNVNPSTAALFLFGVIVISTAVSHYQPHQEIKISPLTEQYISLDLDTNTIVASNTYSANYGYVGRGYKDITKGSVVEPFRESTITLYTLLTGELESNEWVFMKVPVSEAHVPVILKSSASRVNVSDSDVSQSASLYHFEVVVVFKTVGSFKATLVILSSSGSEVTETTYEQSINSYYTRRNIMTLDDADRDAFFDAFKVHTVLSSAEGQAIYGPNYRHIDHFVKVHLNQAGGRRADKFHDGMGFLTQHAALTNEFELSLQAVNGTVSIPYWDFTYEGQLLHSTTEKAEVEDILNLAWGTKLWTDNYFGWANEKLHTVTSGRFAYQQVTVDQNATTKNSYGYLRAPWNSNASPYVTRVHKFCNFSLGASIWPSCKQHYNLTFSMAYQTWFDYIWYMMYEPHGPIHDYIGGYTNCGNLHTTFASLLSPGEVRDIARAMVVLPKTLYRSFFTVGAKYCSTDTPQSLCSMKCTFNPDDPSEVKIVMDILISEIENLKQTGISEHYKFFKLMDYEKAAHLLKLYCQTPWSPGEQLEAGSPVDVSFWPIHPTMDRIFQYKRIVNDFQDLVWRGTADDDEHNDLPYGNTTFCDLGYSTTVAKDYFGVTESKCEGHHPEDLTFFRSMTKGSDGSYQVGKLTNVELLQKLNPKSYGMSYLYDDFTWSHCEADGYDFTAVDYDATAPKTTVSKKTLES